MDSPQPIPFPPFEDLPFVARERIGGLARRVGIPNQKALMLTMLLARSIPMKDLAEACRMMELPVRMSDLWEIRMKMAEWVSEDDHRRGLMDRLERDGLLTEDRRTRLMQARNRREMGTIYSEAVPFESVEGDFKGAPEVFDHFSELNWLAILMAPVRR